MSSSDNNTTFHKDDKDHLKILEDSSERSSAASRSRADSVMASPLEQKLTLELRSTRTPSLKASGMSTITSKKCPRAKSTSPPARVAKSKKSQLKIKIDMRLAWAQDMIKIGRQVKDQHDYIKQNRTSMTENQFLRLQEDCFELRHHVCKHIQAHKMIRHFPEVQAVVAMLVEWELMRQSQGYSSPSLTPDLQFKTGCI